jgi:hypothetical protein
MCTYHQWSDKWKRCSDKASTLTNHAVKTHLDAWGSLGARICIRSVWRVFPNSALKE